MVSLAVTGGHRGTAGARAGAARRPLTVARQTRTVDLRYRAGTPGGPARAPRRTALLGHSGRAGARAGADGFKP